MAVSFTLSALEIQDAFFTQIGSLPVRIRHRLRVPEVQYVKPLVAFGMPGPGKLGMIRRNWLKRHAIRVYREWITRRKPVIEHAYLAPQINA